MALISVVVPVYKVEQYLRRCADSVLSQTFSDFELVLIDDGSPDNCGRTCDEYAEKDRRVHVIHQENGGLSAARNAGIDWAFANSNSEWITFIDSDDWVSLYYLEYLYMAVKETGLDISICKYARTSNDSINVTESCFDFNIENTEEYYVENRVNAIVAWGKLYRKELFSDIRYPLRRIHEDEFTTYKLLFKQKEVAVVNTTLYMYFVNPEGIMQSKWTPKRLDKIYALEEQINYFRDYGFMAVHQMTIYIYAKELGKCICLLQSKGYAKSNVITIRKSLQKVLICNWNNHLLRNDPDYQWYCGLAFPKLMRINRVREAIMKRINKILRR